MIYDPEIQSEIEPPQSLEWFRVIMRIGMIALVMFGFLLPVLLLRLTGFHNGAQAIVSFVCRIVCKIMRFEINQSGTILKGAGFLAANHSSWLDIFVLNGCTSIYFVAKSEVENWPMIGIFARNTGTVFITRKPTEAARQKILLSEHLNQQHRLLFFPEGTSSDGLRILPFRSTIFAAPFEHDAMVQPVTVKYHAPENKREDFYGWYGGMGFIESFLEVLAQR